MNCQDAHVWLNALLDEELDVKNAADVHAHLAGCEACAKRYQSLEALHAQLQREDVRFDVPEALTRRINHMIRPPRASFMDKAPRWAVWAGWPVAVAACTLLWVGAVHSRSDLQQEVVDVHVRSLLANHLSDVVSTDHHTVKPWFAGKIDFSPPVPDLSAQGFDLVGGRLDYLDHRVAAALVYRRHAHFINLLVRPESARSAALPPATVESGYALRAWRDKGLEFIAVSDIEPKELDLFHHAYEAQQGL